jgi:hypothetical protein
MVCLSVRYVLLRPLMAHFLLVCFYRSVCRSKNSLKRPSFSTKSIFSVSYALLCPLMPSLQFTCRLFTGRVFYKSVFYRSVFLPVGFLSVGFLPVGFMIWSGLWSMVGKLTLSRVFFMVGFWSDRFLNMVGKLIWSAFYSVGF